MHALYDIKKSIQRIYQDYAYSISIITTMGLTLGIALFLFTIIYTVQYKPLPNVESSERIIWGTLHTNGSTYITGGLSHHIYDYLNQHQTTLEYFGRIERRGVTLSNANFTEQVRGVAVSPSMFHMLGINAFRGRVLQPSDDIVGDQKNIVISYNLWSSLFNKSEDILNQSIKLNGEPANIIGVMPDGFRFPANQDVWFPESYAVSEGGVHNGWNSVFGRVKDGLSIEDVREEFSRLGQEIVKEYPDQYRGKEISVVSFIDRFAESMSYLMVMLKIASVSILLMGCFSICNMIIVRYLENAKEVLIKLALGIPTIRIVINLLLDSFLLCLLAAIFGLWLCFQGINFFGENVLEGPYWWKLEFQSPTFLLGIFAAFLIWQITAIAPLWMVTRQPTNKLLSSGRKGGSATTLSRVMNSLSILQIFSAFVLVVFTSVLIVGLVRIANADYGVPRDGYLTAEITLSGSKYSTLDQRYQYYQLFIEKAEQIAGVHGAAVSSSLPGVAKGYGISYASSERKIEINGAYPQADEIPISTNYFRVMKMQLIAGREFNEADNAASEAVAVINKSMADILFPEESAIGKQFQHDPEKNGKLVTVVGVVADVISGNPLWYLSPASKDWRAQVYRPMAQVQPEWDANSFIFQTERNLNDIASNIKAIARDIDSEIPLYGIKSFDEFLSENESGFRRLIFIFTPAALLSLIIASLGIYSITRRTILQNISDIGIMRSIGIDEKFINKKYLLSASIQLFVALALGIVFTAILLPKLPTNILIVDSESTVWVSGVASLVIGSLVLLASFIPLIGVHKLTPREAMDYLNVKSD